MSTVTIGRPILRYYRGGDTNNKLSSTKILKPSSSFINFSPIKLLSNGGAATTTGFFCSMPYRPHTMTTIRASSSETALAETAESTDSDFSFKQTFPLSWTQTCEGKIFLRLENSKDQLCWQLSVGCSLPGKWLLHWGVSYVDDVGSEWDQPPENMRPSGSVPIKDYATETPLKKSSESDTFHEVKINLDPKSSIAVINFVLKDEETGTWYQHKGRDFKVPLVDYLIGDGNVVGAKKGFNIWPGAFLSNILPRTDGLPSEDQDISKKPEDAKQKNRQLEGFYEELSISKQVAIQNSVTVSVTKCPKTAKNLLT